MPAETPPTMQPSRGGAAPPAFAVPGMLVVFFTFMTQFMVLLLLGGGLVPYYYGQGVHWAALVVGGVTILVFVLIGQWADRKLGTGGVVTIAAAFLGFGGTMYSLIRQLNKKDGGGE